ncbi:MAG: hypothetical protein IKO10_16390 [Lachnospiraceae bacterium]|nr:hypothetical protein [Lachnospiraceae bacterium]
MGQFSWIDCKNNNRAILIGVNKPCYVLVPQEFRETYGEHITSCNYYGYGVFGGYNIYELAAIWNRENLSAENLEKPQRSRYRNEENYQTAQKIYQKKKNRLMDFVHCKDGEEMGKKYGDDYLRQIGIDIACYDEQNAALKYPIKITYDENAKYEECSPSKDDQWQGCGKYYPQVDKDQQFMTYEDCKQILDSITDETLEEYVKDEWPEEFERDFGGGQDYDK